MRIKELFRLNNPDLSFRAHPLSKLCEYEGAGVPKDGKTDCYQNVDETEFACKEKYRIMVSRAAERVVFSLWLR